MTKHLNTLAILASWALAVSSCAEDTGQGSRSESSNSSRLDQPGSVPVVNEKTKVPPRDSAGPGTVTWTLGGLQERLRREGLEAIAVGEVRQPFMGGPGMRYKLPGGELQAFLYADAGAVARDTDLLDSTTVSPPTMMITWVMPPTLILSNNLAVILITRDPVLREKVRAAVKPDRPSHTKSF